MAIVFCAFRGTGRSQADDRAASQPTSKPTSAEKAELERGWQIIRVANWPAAVKLLEELQAEAADREIRAEALYALATIWHHRRDGDADLDKAIGYYGQVAKDFADTKAAPWAMLALARQTETPEKEPKTEQAREALRAKARPQYRRIVQAHPGHMVADEATVWLAASYLARAGNEEATKTGAEILEAYLDQRPTNYLAVVMHNRLAHYHQQRGSYRKTIEHLIASDAAGLPSEGERARAYFRIARIAERRLGDHALAAKWYERIVTHASHDEKYHVAKLAAQRCRKLAARKGPAQ